MTRLPGPLRTLLSKAAEIMLSGVTQQSVGRETGWHDLPEIIGDRQGEVLDHLGFEVERLSRGGYTAYEASPQHAAGRNMRPIILIGIASRGDPLPHVTDPDPIYAILDGGEQGGLVLARLR